MTAEFKVQVSPGGQTLPARSDQLLLDAVLAAGVDAPYSCRVGCCGSCMARLLAGAIEYPSGRVVSATDTPPPDSVMLCIARPRSDVTLELGFAARVAGLATG